jgi:hypothetical protein
MTDHTHERGPRIAHARLFLVVVFVLQRLGDAAVIRLTFQPVFASSLLRGVAIGSLFWTTALLVGVWRRLSWARYLLIGFNWLYVAAFTYAVVNRWPAITVQFSDPFVAATAGVILYAGANVILIKSRRIRHFASA